MTILLYLAKPTVGGWVTFTAHLSLLKDYKIYKIGKRTEGTIDNPKLREFGYTCKYQNISINDLIKLDQPIMVTALDKNYYDVIDKLPDNTKIVIHDPTELKTNQNNLISNLERFRCITIRKTVQDYLLNYGINSTLLYHPYVSLVSDIADVEKMKNKNKRVSISRIDYDKHTEIILKANNLLLEPIEIYGTKNDMYVYNKLKELDPMKETLPSSNYRGRFTKDFCALSNILSDSKYVVDMSRIKNDGGGSQYTFLEAIDYDCALILHKDWVHNKPSHFIPNVNCFTVADENELVELLNSDQDISKIIDNARDLLIPHLEADGW